VAGGWAPPATRAAERCPITSRSTRVSLYVHDSPTLRTHIANLRRKIAVPYIRTLRGVGYRFEVPRPVALAIEGSGQRGRVPELRAA